MSVFSDDNFAMSNGSPTLFTAVKPKPPRLPSAGEWARGLYEDVPLLAWPHELQTFTLRELCPFGLDWSYKPIPVADSELGQSLLSVQHEKIAMRQAVDEMGGIKAITDGTVRQNVRMRLKTLRTIQDLLEQGLPHIQAMVAPSMEEINEAITPVSAEEVADAAESSEMSMDNHAAATHRSSAANSEAIELYRSLSESKRLQQRSDLSLREDVRKFYAEVEATIDENAIVQSFLEQDQSPEEPEAGPFFTAVGHSEVFAMLSARRDEADEDAIDSAKRKIVEQEVKRFRSRLRIKAGLTPDSRDESSPHVMEAIVADVAASFLAEPLVFEALVSESKCPDDFGVSSYSSRFSSDGDSSDNDFDASGEADDMPTDKITLKLALPTEGDRQELQALVNTSREMWGGVSVVEAAATPITARSKLRTPMSTRTPLTGLPSVPTSLRQRPMTGQASGVSPVNLSEKSFLSPIGLSSRETSSPVFTPSKVSPKPPLIPPLALHKSLQLAEPPSSVTTARTGAIREAANDVLLQILSQLALSTRVDIGEPEVASTYDEPVEYRESEDAEAVTLHGDSVAGLQAFSLMSQLQSQLTLFAINTARPTSPQKSPIKSPLQPPVLITELPDVLVLDEEYTPPTGSDEGKLSEDVAPVMTPIRPVSPKLRSDIDALSPVITHHVVTSSLGESVLATIADLDSIEEEHHGNDDTMSSPPTKQLDPTTPQAPPPDSQQPVLRGRDVGIVKYHRRRSSSIGKQLHSRQGSDSSVETVDFSPAFHELRNGLHGRSKSQFSMADERGSDTPPKGRLSVAGRAAPLHNRPLIRRSVSGSSPAPIRSDSPGSRGSFDRPRSRLSLAPSRQRSGVEVSLSNGMKLVFGPVLGRGASGTVYRADLFCNNIPASIVDNARRERSFIRSESVTQDEDDDGVTMRDGVADVVDNLDDSAWSGDVASEESIAVAVKQLTMTRGESSAGLERMLRLESSMLASLSHPNIVKYYGLHYSRQRREYNMIMEFVGGGSLADHIKLHPNGLAMERVRELTRQLLDGVSYLHSNRIIHRDIKPANLLLTQDGQLKITDFDTATQVVNLKSKKNTCVGTPWYTAPEVIMVEPYSLSADVWSIGCCVLELATGKRPYHTSNSVQALFRMVEEPHPRLPVTDGGDDVDHTIIPEDLQDFLLQVR